ncbi:MULTISPECIES: GntR family transcriptional regulator [Microbacterium]|uniref:GntR family transcriptional regulator n=1 Tax=Microbacterium TaxID=33882 RepID=UPI0013A5804E|nr:MULTISPECIES: GntR family transcriptional regulator [Microbacterium]
MTSESSQQSPLLTPGQTRKEAALASLRKAILTGEIGPGDPVREVQMAEALDVSRSTLREAVQTLVHEGLLVQEKYKGVRVARLNRKSVEDLGEVRVKLETMAAQKIAKDPTGKSQKMLREALEEYLASGDLEDPVAEQATHLALHRTVWFAPGNEVLQRVWTSIESFVNLSTATNLAAHHGDVARQHRRHTEYVECILAGDDDAIAAMVEDHVLDNVLLYRLRPGFDALASQRRADFLL